MTDALEPTPEPDDVHTSDNRYRKYARYEILAVDLPTAWQFIMAHVDEFPSPDIVIESNRGSWDINEDGSLCEPYVRYRTSVSGDIEGGY